MGESLLSSDSTYKWNIPPKIQFMHIKIVQFPSVILFEVEEEKLIKNTTTIKNENRHVVFAETNKHIYVGW